MHKHRIWFVTTVGNGLQCPLTTDLSVRPLNADHTVHTCKLRSSASYPSVYGPALIGRLDAPCPRKIPIVYGPTTNISRRACWHVADVDRFKPAAVQQVIHGVLVSKLQDKTYDDSQVGEWTAEISEEIKEQLKGGNQPCCQGAIELLLYA